MDTKSEKVTAALRLLGVEPTAPEEAQAPVREHNEKAREEIDAFFSGPIMAALTRLHAQGRLPTLNVPEWEPIDREWAKASEGSPTPCDVAVVKRLMVSFIEARGLPTGRAE